MQHTPGQHTLCKDCEYLVAKVWCSAPKNGISLVNGEPIVQIAEISRRDSEQCGIDARYFKEKKYTFSTSWWSRWINQGAVK
jgi:hypothetical protein